MTTADTQKRFLEAIASDTQPLTYVHAALTYSVYVTQLIQTAPYKHAGRDEPVFTLRMVETATGATGVNAQEHFLLAAADDVAPLHYTDPRGDVHRVILTQISKSRPFKFEGRVEPVWSLVMVDSWSGFSIQDSEAAKVAAIAAVSPYDYVTAKWGPGEDARWGFSQWG